MAQFSFEKYEELTAGQATGLHLFLGVKEIGTVAESLKRFRNPLWKEAQELEEQLIEFRVKYKKAGEVAQRAGRPEIEKETQTTSASAGKVTEEPTNSQRESELKRDDDQEEIPF